jgi:transporter family protein
MSLVLGIIFGLGAMLSFGFHNAISQVPAKELGSEKTIFYKGFVTSVLFFMFMFFFVKPEQFRAEYFLLSLLLAFVGYLALRFLLNGLKVGKVGVVVPIANTSVIYTVLLSFIFFGERLSTFQYLAILLIVIGVFVVSVNFNEFKNTHKLFKSSGIYHAIFTSLLWGILYFVMKIPVNVIGPILTSFFIEFGATIFSYIHLKVNDETINFPKKSMIKYLVLVGILIGLGTLLMNLGFMYYKVSFVAVLVFSSPIVSTLYGKFVYKDKLSSQQWFATFLILAGLVVISLF